MNCDIYVPVRLRSTRLPQKAIKEISGKPVIQYLIERLKTTKKIRNVIVCTTALKDDNPLVEFLEKEKIMVYKGNEKDILDRYLQATKYFDTDFIVSVDGDDIYTDPLLVDRIVSEFEKTKADYIDMMGYPFGLAPVGIKTESLQKICDIKKTDNTETGYRLFFTQTNLFKVLTLKPEFDIKFAKNLRLTLDYNEDFELAKVIFKSLGNNFHVNDLLKLFEERPELLKITDSLQAKYKEHWNKNVADISIRDI
jgi:spore coat polysaccharide biosynthesis protein SpsF (cytidylyltransferase family)